MKRNFNDPAYKKWRNEVYKRDNFECQWPNCNVKNRLNAHHIQRWADHPGLRYNISNGITLCRIHHKMITGLESIYSSIFIKILADKNNEKS
jgi:predicted restriction endonuclease